MSYEGDLVATYATIHKRLLNGHRSDKIHPPLVPHSDLEELLQVGLLRRMQALEDGNKALQDGNKALRKRIELLELKTGWKANIHPHSSHIYPHKEHTLIDDIFQLVAAREGLNSTLILSDQRIKRVCEVRNIIYYLAALHTLKSLPQIGAFMKRDHTTIMHGRDKIARERLTNTELDAKLTWYEEQIACLTKAKNAP